MLKVGDYVTRKKYNNDIIFKVDKIVNNVIYLKGIDVRLYADSFEDDLILTAIPKKKDELVEDRILNTKDYFYIPGTILHLDSDEDYLNQCEKYYKSKSIKYSGYIYKESDFSNNIPKLLSLHKPSILVITGHDAYYLKEKDGKHYKNSEYYIKAIKEARKIFDNHNKLIIISGACQSDYEGMIFAGATYASSPKRINIHALDPAIIATSLALTEKTEIVNIEELLNKTKYGKDGIGGLIINGTMYKGYPRKE